MDFGLTVVVDVVAIMPLSLGAADRDLDRAGDLPLPSALNAATLPIVFDGIAIFGVFDRALAADGLRALMTVVEVKPAVLCDDDALDGALDVALDFFSGFMLATDSSRFSAVSGVSSLSLPMLYLSGSPTCNANGSTVVAPPSPCLNRDINAAALRVLDLSSVLLVVAGACGDDERSPRVGTAGVGILIAGSGFIPWALRVRSRGCTAVGIGVVVVVDKGSTAVGAGATWSAPSCLSACCCIQFS